MSTSTTSRRPSASMVIALAALLISLTSSALGQRGAERTSASQNSELPSKKLSPKDLKTLLDQLQNKLTAAHLKSGAVRSSELAPRAVTTAKLKPLAVTTDQIGPGSITAALLAVNSVTPPALAQNSVTTSAIAPNAVTSSEIANLEVQSDDIDWNAVTTYQLAPQAVSTDDIGNDAVGTQQVAAAIPAVSSSGASQPMPHSTNSTACNPWVPAGCRVFFNTDLYDSSNMHDAGANSSVFQAPVDGVYKVDMIATWEQNDGGYRQLNLRKSGQTIATNTVNAVVGAATHQELVHTAFLSAGDTFEVRANASFSSCAPNCSTAFLSMVPQMTVTWVHPGS